MKLATTLVQNDPLLKRKATFVINATEALFIVTTLWLLYVSIEALGSIDRFDVIRSYGPFAGILFSTILIYCVYGLLRRKAAARRLSVFILWALLLIAAMFVLGGLMFIVPVMFSMGPLVSFVLTPMFILQQVFPVILIVLSGIALRLLTRPWLISQFHD